MDSGHARGNPLRGECRIAAGRFLCAALGVSCLAASAWGISISLNPANQSGNGWAADTPDIVTGATAVGAPGYAAVGMSWNNMRQNDVGAARQLRDSANPAGNDSGVWAMWRSASIVGFSPTIPLGATANIKMMWGGYGSTDESNDAPPPPDFFGRSANQPLIYVRGLAAWLTKAGQPAGANSYAVILYVGGDGTDHVSEYWLQRVPPESGDPPTALGLDLAGHVFVHEDGTPFTHVFTPVPAAADSEGRAANGNYILWQGLTADRFVVRTEARSSGGGYRRAVISGVQIVAEASTKPAITMAATDAAEPAGNGTFTITCSGVPVAPLTVYYAVGGTATAGADYVAEDLSGSVTIPAGSNSASITIRPKSDALVEGTETITLALLARGEYRDGTPGGASVTMCLADEPRPVHLDADRDGDIDQVDFAAFQRCFSGLDHLVATPACLEMDVDGDARVSSVDFEEFARCMSGPGVAAREECLTP